MVRPRHGAQWSNHDHKRGTANGAERGRFRDIRRRAAQSRQILCIKGKARRRHRGCHCAHAESMDARGADTNGAQYQRYSWGKSEPRTSPRFGAGAQTGLSAIGGQAVTDDESHIGRPSLRYQPRRPAKILRRNYESRDGRRMALPSAFLGALGSQNRYVAGWQKQKLTSDLTESLKTIGKSSPFVPVKKIDSSKISPAGMIALIGLTANGN